MVLDDHHGDGRFAIWCAAAPGIQQTLVDADPKRFFVPPYVGHRGWLGVRLDRGLDWDELAGIAEDVFAEVAPRAPAVARFRGGDGGTDRLAARPAPAVVPPARLPSRPPCCRGGRRRRRVLRRAGQRLGDRPDRRQPVLSADQIPKAPAFSSPTSPPCRRTPGSRTAARSRTSATRRSRDRQSNVAG